MKRNNFLFFKTFLKTFFGAAAFCIFATSSTFAQSVSDDELNKYAVVMDSIDAMKRNIQDDYNAMIQEEELMQGGRRFVEIQQVGDDSVRLTELNVTEMELEAFNKIQEKYTEMTTDFKESYTNLIKEDLGAALYNKVTKALKDDSEVKNRYDSILEEVKAEGTEESDETGTLTEPGQENNSGLNQSGELNDSEDSTSQTEGAIDQTEGTLNQTEGTMDQTEGTMDQPEGATSPMDTTGTTTPSDVTTPMEDDINGSEDVNTPVEGTETPAETGGRIED
ncbi:MAG: hypothetical protein M3512_05605 [Bacteroidota bacterium]|nr:hypothetical protein [Bacteroidota bacterium]